MALQALGFARRVWETDILQIRTISSIALPITANADLLFDNGQAGHLRWQQINSASNRTESITPSPPVPRNGWITNLVVEGGTGQADRGQLYCRIEQRASSGSLRDHIASGYLYGSRNLNLGDKQDPTAGQGDTKPESIGTDIAGNVDTTLDLNLTNGVRRIDGIIWYYHCSSDVAARVTNFRILAPGGSVPTGFDAGNDRQVLAFAGPALAADEDGILYMGAQGMYTTVTDENVVTTSDNTTAPNPFPFWIHADDINAQMVFDITDGEALDTYQAFLMGESWFI